MCQKTCKHSAITFLNLLTVRQDFGGGPAGPVYQQQLNVSVRYAKKKFPDEFYYSFTMRGHDISNILEKIESEATPIVTYIAAFKQQGQNQPKLVAIADEELQQNLVGTENQQESKISSNHVQRQINNIAVPSKIFRPPWKSEDCKRAAREAGICHAKGDIIRRTREI